MAGYADTTTRRAGNAPTWIGDLMQPASPETPVRPPRRWRLLIGVCLIAIAVGSFVISTFFIRWNDVLVRLQERRQELDEWVRDYPLSFSVAYVLIYVGVTALSLPGALILTLLGGAIFGAWWGTLLVSFGSTGGATLAFLASRHLLCESVQVRYADRLKIINRELDQSGGFYLLALRLNPVVPFFVINLAFGLTRMPAWQFWIISQIGMLPATFIYANAGARLVEIKSLADILSWPLLVSLLALSVFPLAARAAAAWLRRRS
jgi:uncharacterized membrane protein YdjX (TVP38/TMEM64 family)